MMKRRKETLLGQLNQDDAAKVAEPVGPLNTGGPGLPRWVTIGSAAVGILLVAYLLLGFFFAPWLIKKLLPEKLEAQYPLEVALERVHVNPVTFTVSLHDFALQEESGQIVVSFEQLRIKLKLLGLLGRGVHLKDLVLNGPSINVVLDPQGGLNLLELFASEKTVDDPSENSLPVLRVDQLSVKGGRVTFRDERLDEAFSTSLHLIDFSLEKFSTRESTREEDGTFALRAEGAGGFVFQTDGRLDPAAVGIEGQLLIDNINLDHYNLYWLDLVSLEIAEGLANLELNYRFSLEEGLLQILVSEGNLRLLNATLGAPEAPDKLLEMERLELMGLHFDSMAQTVSIQELQLDRATASAILDTDGEWNFFAALPANSDSASASPVPENPSWSWEIQSILLSEFTLAGEDRLRGVTYPRLQLDELSANRIASDQQTTTDWIWKGGVGESGRIEGSAAVSLESGTAEIAIAATALPLSWLSPYLESSRGVQLRSGMIDFSGGATIYIGADATEWGLRDIDGGLQGLQLVSLLDGTVKVVVADLTWTGFSVRSSHHKVEGSEVSISGLDGTIVRGPEAEWLLPWGSSPEKAGITDESVPSTAGDNWQIQVGMIRLAESRLALMDQTMPEEFGWGMSVDEGSVAQLGAGENELSTFEIFGKINDESPWSLTGSGDLFDAQNRLNAAFALDTTSLTRINPYAERFLGRRLSRGNLRLDLDYEISDQSLNGSNRIVIDQLALGPSVESADRITNFPLGLAVAALQDGRGLIEMDVSVSGRLDDPGFRVSGLVMRAILNLLATAATSPFSMLANLVGSEKELSSVAFEPGGIDLTPDARDRLSELAAALDRRPQLALELYAENQREQDTIALKRQQVEMRLQRLQHDNNEAPQGDFHSDRELYRLLLDFVLNSEAEDPVGIAPTPEYTAVSRIPPEIDAPRPEPSATAEPQPRLEVATVERNPAPGFLGQLFGIGGRPNQPTSTDPVEIPAADSPVVEVEKPPVISLEFPDEILEVSEAEALLLERIEISSERLLNLARQREAAVRNYLVEQGSIAADRVFTVDRDATSSDTREPQVVFSITVR